MEITNYYLLKIGIENDSTADVHLTAEVKNYFWIDSKYEDGIDKTLAKKVRTAFSKIKDARMIDVELIKSSTAWRSPNDLVEAYRFVKEHRWEGGFKESKHNGNTSGAVFNFDYAPIVQLPDILAHVKRLQKIGYALYREERGN